VQVFGDWLDVPVRAGEGTLRLSELVPIARRLTDRLTGWTIRAACHAGKPPSCRAGCSACCRYLVPLSPPEAMRLRAELHQLPSQARQRLTRACRAAGLRVMQATRRLPPAHCEAEARESYASLQIDCPLLEGGLCSLYDWRPLACRTYHVVSEPLLCADPSESLHERLALPFSPTQALCRLSAELEGTDPQAVLLPLALDWADRNAARAKRAWPTGALIGRFQQACQEQVNRLTAAAAA
jgi:Fe-S-cluster containining protein